MSPTQGIILYTLLPMAALLEDAVPGHHPAQPLQEALPQQCMMAALSGLGQVTLHLLPSKCWSIMAAQKHVLQAF